MIDRRRCDQIGEALRIDVDDFAIEANVVGRDIEDFRRQIAKRELQIAHEIACARLAVRTSANQFARFAQRRFARNFQCEIDDERLRPLVAHRQRIAAVVNGGEIAEEPDF